MSAPALAVLPKPTRKHLIQVTALAWLAIISVDLLMNAGILGPFLNWEQPGFLPPIKMFQYIPLGYAAFLLLAILILWLMLLLKLSGARAGAVFGAKFGGLLAAAGWLGEMSIFAFPTKMLFFWALEKTLFCTVLGAVLGSGLAAPRLRPLTRRVVVLFFLCIVVAVAMQNLGLVPARTIKGQRVGIVQWDPNK